MTRNVMRLNHTIAEITNNFTEYGEGLYNLTVMGEPSATEPWGWQLEGHHLIVNYFVLGDQVVMTPAFMGLGAGHRGVGQVQGHGRAAGRAEQGARADAVAHARAAAEGDASRRARRPRTTRRGRPTATTCELPYAGIKGSD